MPLNRRSFLEKAFTALTLPLVVEAAQAAQVSRGGTPVPKRAAPASSSKLNLSSKTVSFLNDISPISAQERIAELHRLLISLPEANDTYLTGGAVEALEEKVAILFGKEDAAFLPTGTMANNIAVRLLCGERRHALVQEDSHLYKAESDSAQILSGLNLVPLAPGEATPAVDVVARAVADAATAYVPTPVGAISLESPAVFHNGETIPFATLKAIEALAKEHGIGMHWDGARSLMMTGTPEFDLMQTSQLFDTVYLSLYKYLEAPFGAVLSGPRELIAKARNMRHIYGGRIYQGWLSALPALNALATFQTRLLQARSSFDAVLRGLNAAGGFDVRPVRNGSNVTFLQISAERLQGLAERLTAADISAHVPSDGNMKLTLNLSVLRRSPQELISVFTQM